MKLKDLPLGAELRFGSYGFTDDTVEPITWSLVNKSGILFSKYVIGQIEYNRESAKFNEEDVVSIPEERSVCVVEQDGDVTQHYPYPDDPGIGFRPYIRLNPDIEVVGPNLGGAYQVVCSTLSRQKEIKKEDLLDILNV